MIYFKALNISAIGRGSSVGIATRYGLGGPGIEFRRGEIFRTRPDRSFGPSSLHYSGYRVSFPGVKRPGRGVDHPPPLNAGVKERVEIYLCFPLWDFVACCGVKYFSIFHRQVRKLVRYISLISTRVIFFFFLTFPKRPDRCRSPPSPLFGLTRRQEGR